MVCAVANAGASLTATSLVGRGIREEPAEEGEGSWAIQTAAEELAQAGGTGRLSGENSKKAGPVKLGAGLSAVPGVLAGRIRRGEYVDFTEFPPALPDGSAAGVQSSEQLLIVQAADYRRTRRRVPDVAVWTRCFILFIGTVTAEEPERLMGLLGYMDAIVRAAQKFAWPACEEYDRRFCQMVVGDERRPWARLDAGLYTECFTAQALPTPAARDSARGGLAGHMAGLRKRPRETVGAKLGEQDRAEAGAPVCGKYNRYRGDCKFGVRCRFQHICSRCKGQHPVSQCEAGQRV